MNEIDKIKQLRYKILQLNCLHSYPNIAKTTIKLLRTSGSTSTKFVFLPLKLCFTDDSY
jgi:hypothetical protein